MNQKGFAHIILLIGVIVVVGLVIGGSYYLEKNKPSVGPTPTQISISSSTAPSQIPPMSPIVSQKESTSPQSNIKSPQTYGYTKLIELPGIGVRAYFPEGVKITYENSVQEYSVSIGGLDSATFTLKDYAGGGRREWFQKYYGYKQNIFEAFTASTHSGYMSYFKDSSGKVIAPSFYFAVIGTNKMLVITGNASNPGQYFFGGSLDKMRSFLSGVQITHADNKNTDPNETTQPETERSSDKRKVVWDNSSLGLRVTAPEWIESRIRKKLNSDGTWEYGEWIRTVPEVKSDQPNQFYITGYFFGGSILTILDTKYTGKSFNYVADDFLFPAEFCTTGWSLSKSECMNPSYCYTKDEVVKNLFVKKTAKFGPYTGQLRALNAAFSQQMDCRAEDEWLIQAKGGQFVSSTIPSSGEPILLEGY